MHAPRYLTQTLTLAGLGALVLSGCGEKATGSIPEPGDGSSSAVSSASASTGGAGASEGATAEAAESYSGGSKAPEGEYRAADEQGPAQNVPRPVQPEGMNVESDEGLEKFLGYWAESVNYGLQTGDFSYAEPLISEKYESDQEVYIWAEEIYNRDGWLTGGLREVKLGEGLLVAQGDGVYTWGGMMPTLSAYSYVGQASDYVDNSWTKNHPVIFQATYSDGQWRLDGVSSAEEGSQ